MPKKPLRSAPAPARGKAVPLPAGAAVATQRPGLALRDELSQIIGLNRLKAMRIRTMGMQQP